MRCTATRTNGTPCQATALPGRELCWAHDPEHREKANEARRNGGMNRSNIARATKALPPHFAAIAEQLHDAIAEVHTGLLSPPRLTAMAAGASALLRIYEHGELEARLAALEERAAQPNSATRRGW